MTPTEFRQRFPIFRQRVYVNSCSQGALSTDVEAAVQAYLASWRDGGSPWDLWVNKVDELRRAFAAVINADPDEIAVMPSASCGISSVATALAFDAPRSGVVMGEFEFPTMAHPFLAQQGRGAAVGWARASGDELPLSAYEAVVDDRTLVVPATHVCFRNGYRTDVAGLGRLCRDRGALLFLDDYQSTGSSPIDVRTVAVDMLVTGCLKYLLGPAGIAFLYVRRDLIERLEPTVTGWFGRADPFAFAIDRLDWSPTARRFEGGTPPIINAFAGLAGLEVLQQVGVAAAAAHIERLAGRCIAGAQEAGFQVRTPTDPARRGPLVVIESLDATTLVARLAARGVIASSRGQGLRVSFHAYNNDEDVDIVLDALRAESALLPRIVPRDHAPA